MDTLPVEIFTEILRHLPPSSQQSARLTSRQFNIVLAPSTFAKLRTFIDPNMAMTTLHTTLRHMSCHDGGRRAAVWSPNCSVPTGLPLPRSFLNAMYAALAGQPWQHGGEAYPAVMRQRYTLVDSSDDSSSDESEHEVMTDRTIEDAVLYKKDQYGQGSEADGMCTAVVLQRLRPDINEDVLRQALFRYALYKSYTYEGEGEAPQMWVMNSKKWKYQL